MTDFLQNLHHGGGHVLPKGHNVGPHSNAQCQILKLPCSFTQENLNVVQYVYVPRARLILTPRHDLFDFCRAA
jgi:hypothetical protein